MYNPSRNCLPCQRGAGDFRQQTWIPFGYFKSCATESTRNEEMVLLYSVYHATNVALHSIQLYELAKLEGVLSSETVGRIRRRVGIVEKCKMRLQSN
mmetsp:Transcript_188/g.378  ORF Transcript_188/g.378 Transcript_188/m.378 type:complete len:97 (-) Transcript_188:749-1039(-)